MKCSRVHSRQRIGASSTNRRRPRRARVAPPPHVQGSLQRIHEPESSGSSRARLGFRLVQETFGHLDAIAVLQPWAIGSTHQAGIKRVKKRVHRFGREFAQRLREIILRTAQRRPDENVSPEHVLAKVRYVGDPVIGVAARFKLREQRRDCSGAIPGTRCGPRRQNATW